MEKLAKSFLNCIAIPVQGSLEMVLCRFGANLVMPSMPCKRFLAAKGLIARLAMKGLCMSARGQLLLLKRVIATEMAIAGGV
ncbi:uncharacterized protein SETTUDRAFT_169190 [Exserohilum turcica Et28A]|uniref:Uncharacterized protein n=1 Tax=Exserohilum turcicum (strain 28A) TaxID=671987 RepID=R0KAH0_EXST2|nr:uncharacterized protein SETTUDRAFT_169190 [Exserohilum turcica Et28A]EOA86429.1 hypothetical protein SETTUDRAFT_169190 [Exserohilum turcica Et28A]